MRFAVETPGAVQQTDHVAGGRLPGVPHIAAVNPRVPGAQPLRAPPADGDCRFAHTVIINHKVTKDTKNTKQPLGVIFVFFVSLW